MFVQRLSQATQDVQEAMLVQYDLADSIRKRLEKLGIQLEDTPTGTTWSIGN